MAMARGWSSEATCVSRTLTAARLGPPPPPAGADEVGAGVDAGRRVVRGAAGAAVVAGAARAATAEDVVEEVDGLDVVDRPVAPSRWWPPPPPPDPPTKPK